MPLEGDLLEWLLDMGVHDGVEQEFRSLMVLTIIFSLDRGVGGGFGVGLGRFGVGRLNTLGGLLILVELDILLLMVARNVVGGDSDWCMVLDLVVLLALCWLDLGRRRLRLGFAYRRGHHPLLSLIHI